MPQPDELSFDFLTGREGDFMETVMDDLKAVPWAKPLVADINKNGGLKGENKAKLFELRFGSELHKAGIQPRYEVAGEGDSTLDYGFASGGQEYLVEMMRLEETDAVRAATTKEEFEDGAVMVKRQLTTTAEDSRQSEEGETLKAVERICQKFERDGTPHKFPPPGSATHVLLADVRTLFNGGDKWDRVNVGLGGEYVPHEFFRRYYRGRLVTGVFSPKTTLKGAAEARERLHFIGFVNEQSYENGGFGSSIQFIANPHLFKSVEDARAALAGWPLGEPEILNAPKVPPRLQKLVHAMSNLKVGEAAELSQLLRSKWRLPSSDADR
ncbi:hypothetical protein [Bradyrhizobium iriomotense]|uniref:hypothetical protein n=1 Tax=Bradyrhizobium iriomotense TaxID=441950 RepID=UPI001B8A2548|nr:hypothetical protein [Bradyrhizobium iriomotense]MBR1129896.1 hypothetical protein [Bradyrhizobium iriomotense]